uniref:Retrotransposon protein, putative, Ty3-gypsy sub-class n=2 Tax=Oryza sativa subsp. japonica TaxID=39947 RepID=Q53KC6_ORYSJ|nr:retrotransposon protein, putative, Ty3-gypsy sub-class [Oryza sativa Japonica Group]AAX95937.1 retrotransposon protein, putative, Ty3-gypsy sub-class [Oryza sativa Japonica Group]ABA93393.1 retrotransposon protein, putative, Ty3-gypsy subclass [Oryza sativa Japonica Group]
MTGTAVAHGWSDGDDGGSRLHGARALPTARDESKGGGGSRRHRGSFYRGKEAAAKAHGDRRREGKLGLGERETDPTRPRNQHFPNDFSRGFQKRKGRRDPEDHFPSIDFTGNGKTRPNLEGDGGARVSDGGGQR